MDLRTIRPALMRTGLSQLTGLPGRPCLTPRVLYTHSLFELSLLHLRHVPYGHRVHRCVGSILSISAIPGLSLALATHRTGRCIILRSLL